MKKTRRGFFAALAGAVAAPFLLAKTALAKSAELGYSVGDTVTHGDDKYVVESVTEDIPVGDFKKRYPDHAWAFDEIVPVKLCPEPYELQFHPVAFAFVMEPWPWDPLDLGNERTITITNPDGVPTVATINQGA